MMTSPYGTGSILDAKNSSDPNPDLAPKIDSLFVDRLGIERVCCSANECELVLPIERLTSIPRESRMEELA